MSYMDYDIWFGLSYRVHFRLDIDIFDEIFSKFKKSKVNVDGVILKKKYQHYEKKGCFVIGM